MISLGWKRSDEHLDLRVMKDRLLWLASTLLVLASASCDQPAAGLVDPCISPEFYFGEPRADPPEWIDPPRRNPIVFERPESGWLIHFWLPWSLNRESAYPIEGEQSVFVRMRIMLGDDFDAESDRIVVFVDGRVVPIRFDGESRTQTLLSMEGGLADVTIEIPSEAFGDGLSTVHVYHRLWHGHRWSRYGAVNHFSVLRGAVPDWHDRATWPGADTPLAPRAYDPGYLPSLVVPLGPDRNQPWQPQYLVYDGHERFDGEQLYIRMQPNVPCDTEIDHYAVVALLDGVQVPIGDQDVLYATQRSGEAGRFDFTFHIPEGRHMWELLYLTGIGRPTRGYGDVPTFLPWLANSRMVTTVWSDDGGFDLDP